MFYCHYNFHRRRNRYRVVLYPWKHGFEYSIIDEDWTFSRLFDGPCFGPENVPGIKVRVRTKTQRLHLGPLVWKRLFSHFAWKSEPM
jgi:hypothetical protein